MRDYEFNIYDQDVNPVGTQVHEFDETSQAKSKARSYAKKYGGPVDVAFCNEDAWDVRYIGTARPEPFNTSGTAFERLT